MTRFVGEESVFPPPQEKGEVVVASLDATMMEAVLWACVGPMRDVARHRGEQKYRSGWCPFLEHLHRGCRTEKMSTSSTLRAPKVVKCPRLSALHTLEAAAQPASPTYAFFFLGTNQRLSILTPRPCAAL